MSEATLLLQAIEQGEPQAAEKLLPLIYEELRKLATARLAKEKPGQTLQATALVHEAYLRLVGPDKGKGWNSRGHFFGAAAEAMRRILVDQAQQKLSQGRGGSHRRLGLADVDCLTSFGREQILDLDEALGKLSAVDADAGEIVKLRIFAGMTNEEIASMKAVSESTVKRSWAYARAWLGRELASYHRSES